MSDAPLPTGYGFLDAPALLAVVNSTGAPLSGFLINMGCVPSFGEDGERKLKKPADDVTPLWHAGYRGVNFDIPSSLPSLKFLQRWAPKSVVDARGILPSGFAAALEAHGTPKGSGLDFLKIDIDSFDCDYLEVVLHAGYRPKVIMMEATTAYPPPLKFWLRFSSNFSYAASTGTPISGCSLQTISDLLGEEYVLVQYALEDAWFVQRRYAHGFGPIEPSLLKHYVAGNPRTYGAWPAMQQKLLAAAGSPKRMLKMAQGALDVVLDLKPRLKTGNFQLGL